MSSTDTLLLDMMNRLGIIEGQNSLILAEQGRAAGARKVIYERLDATNQKLIRIEHVASDVAEMKPKVERIAGVIEDVAEMKPHVESSKHFQVKIAVVVLFVTAIITGAVNLLWIGLTHMGEIKDAVRYLIR